MSLPKISIVTPSLNQGDTIEQTILSVQEQGYEPFEHFVIDGGSSDGTLDVLERYPHLLWVSEPDEGQTDAINKGLRRADGEIVAYLNADDLYRPGAFVSVAEAFRDPQCQALVGDCDIVDEYGATRGVYLAQIDDARRLLRWWEWNRGVCIPQPAVFLRRSALEAVGLFDPSFDMAMDLEMWMRLAKRFELTGAGRTLAAYRETAETKTSKRPADMALECDRAARLHIDLEPAGSRAALVQQLDRQAAGHLLTFAEEGGGKSLLWKALRYSPAIAASARFWRTLVSPAARRGSSASAVEA